VVDFVSALATAAQAIKLTQDLRGIQKEFDEAEWKLKVAELNGTLADLKSTLVDAKEEMAGKDDELKLLGDNFLVLKETVEYRGYRYDKTAAGGPKAIHTVPYACKSTAICFSQPRLTRLDAPSSVQSAKLNFQRRCSATKRNKGRHLRRLFLILIPRAYASAKRLLESQTQTLLQKSHGRLVPPLRRVRN
jgi:hypothetical protein